jgi:lysozyme
LSAQTRGIDVSKFQGTINWTKVAKDSTIKFVYIKATEGTSMRDPNYKTNISKARKAGLLVGFYHVYSPKTTAYKQMANIRKTVKKKDLDLIPVLDIEGRYSDGLYMVRVDKLLELLEKEYGVKPMIYTSEHCYKQHFTGKKYAKYHFFIAKYSGGAPSVRHTLWQYTESGHVKGVSGDVDISKFNRRHALGDIKMPKKKKKAAKEDDGKEENAKEEKKDSSQTAK